MKSYWDEIQSIKYSDTMKAGEKAERAGDIGREIALDADIGMSEFAKLMKAIHFIIRQETKETRERRL